MTRFGTAVQRIDERQAGVELPLLSVSQTRGVIRQSELFDRPPRADSLDTYKICRRNDIVFNKMSIRAGALGVAQEDGLVTYHYEVMRPIGGASSRYIAYLMKSHRFIGELIARERGIGAGGATGVRTTEVPFSILRTIDAFIPGPPRQESIADYLDVQTAKIDALVGKQEQLIETLAERRQAVISHAVTKGLDPNAPMKESGVDWLGQVPSAWAIAQVKRCGAVTLGKMVQPEARSDTDIRAPYMRAANVQPDGVLALDDVNEMWFSVRELKQLGLRKGDVVVVEGGMGGFGRSAFVGDELRGWGFQNSINRLRPNASSDGRFLTYSLLTARAVGYMRAVCSAVSMPHLTAEKLEALRVPKPPLTSQLEIVAYLDHETAKIDALAAKAREMIDVLKERRQALISAAVTGKIDVRGLA